jgi:N-acetylmuramoyl-L-alanine amidase
MHLAAKRVFCLASLFLAGCAHLTPNTPSSPVTADWSRLDPWANALTADEWRAALDDRFAPNGAAKGYVEITPDGHALGFWPGADKPPPLASLFYLPTRSSDASRPTTPPGARYWRTRDEMGPATPDKPLAGLRIALDPGHLGGKWGPMEGRSFSFNGDSPVQEGDLALHTAQLLAPRLEALGAQVSFVRDRPGPVTVERPETLRPQAEAQWLAAASAKGGPIPPPGDPAREAAITRLSETMFYGTSEITARAHRVNDVLKPDLVLCMHLDAVDWPDPKHPALVNVPEHYHLMVNGSYLPSEIARPDEREEMLERIASGADVEELSVALALAEGSVPVFGQKASGYSLPIGVALGGNGYVWGRNLMATRVYRCPVVFLEPYVANSVEGYARIQAGEYPGTRDFNGVPRKNIFEEYSDAVVAGLVNYYAKRDSK